MFLHSLLQRFFFLSLSVYVLHLWMMNIKWIFCSEITDNVFLFLFLFSFFHTRWLSMFLVKFSSLLLNTRHLEDLEKKNAKKRIFLFLTRARTLNANKMKLFKELQPCLNVAKIELKKIDSEKSAAKAHWQLVKHGTKVAGGCGGYIWLRV